MIPVIEEHRITSKEGLQQTIKSIEMMTRSLYSLTEEILPKSQEWFAVMAEGPVDQIRDLLDEIDTYIIEITKPLAEEAEAWETQQREAAGQEECEREEMPV